MVCPELNREGRQHREVAPGCLLAEQGRREPASAQGGICKGGRKLRRLGDSSREERGLGPQVRRRLCPEGVRGNLLVSQER